MSGNKIFLLLNTFSCITHAVSIRTKHPTMLPVTLLWAYFVAQKEAFAPIRPLEIASWMQKPLGPLQQACFGPLKLVHFGRLR